MITYALASPVIFRSIQGEGAMLGRPMTFIRLAGCSVGCSGCDTDYRAASRMAADGIVDAARSITPEGGWAWITGGEPADRDLGPLIEALKAAGLRVALATSGHMPAPWRVDWLSVSPHVPAWWTLKTGDELKIIPQLAGHGLADFAPYLSGSSFRHRFVSPCAGRPETVAECVAWVETNPSWRMTCQAHKQWGLA